jgi:hypothetical protein
LECGEKVTKMGNVSYLSDALADLLHAVASMLTDGRGTAVWDREPGTYSWQMSRSGSEARIQVFEFDDDDGCADEMRGRSFSAADGDVLLDETCDAVTFGVIVQEAASLLRSSYESSFRRRFPEEPLSRLTTAIQKAVSVNEY